jgi:hypothetical protein
MAPRQPVIIPPLVPLRRTRRIGYSASRGYHQATTTTERVIGREMTCVLRWLPVVSAHGLRRHRAGPVAAGGASGRSDGGAVILAQPGYGPTSRTGWPIPRLTAAARAVEVPIPGELIAGRGAFAFSVSCASARNCAAGGSYLDGSGHPQAFVVGDRNGRWAWLWRCRAAAATRSGRSTVISWAMAAHWDQPSSPTGSALTCPANVAMSRTTSDGAYEGPECTKVMTS